jgi:hypothetical protein
MKVLSLKILMVIAVFMPCGWILLPWLNKQLKKAKEEKMTAEFRHHFKDIQFARWS